MAHPSLKRYWKLVTSVAICLSLPLMWTALIVFDGLLYIIGRYLFNHWVGIILAGSFMLSNVPTFWLLVWFSAREEAREENRHTETTS